MGVLRNLISMDDLTPQEKSEAAAQNWGLFHVFDAEKSRWLRTVLPVTFNETATAANALNHVVAQAKFNNPLSIKALRLMAQYNAGTKKK